MFKLSQGFAIVLTTVTLCVPCRAFAVELTGQPSGPTTTLTYHFSYSANQQITARDSANPAQDYGKPNGAGYDPMPDQASGQSHYEGSLTDKGTMTVVVIGKQPDGGLIVKISEAGETIRRAPPATCVVYGNTRVICDPNKTVYTEEYTLLRFLGLNFVDPTQLDANKHWQATGLNGPGIDVSANYTIDGTANGQMQIGESRKIRAASNGAQTTDTESKIGYDFKRSLPTSVDEYTQQRGDSGISGTTREVYQTTLQLVSVTQP